MSKLKEAYLRSGVDLKTINGKPITGEGNLKINEIPAGGVTPAQIANNAVDTGKLANNAVTTNKIANKAVTEQKLADAVTEKLLPTVTSSDAGKVASVDENGEWVAAEAGGGGGSVFYVTFTKNSGTISADKTLQQIKTALESGYIIIGIYVYRIFYLTEFDTADYPDFYGFYFNNVVTVSGEGETTGHKISYETSGITITGP